MAWVNICAQVCKFRLERLQGQPDLTTQCVMASHQDVHSRAGLLKDSKGKPYDLAQGTHFAYVLCAHDAGTGLEKRPIYVFDARHDKKEPPKAFVRDQSVTITEQINQLPPGGLG